MAINFIMKTQTFNQV